MIKAQFLKTTCLFTWLPGLSCHTAPSLCHAGSSLQHRDSPVAAQAELLCGAGSSASRPRTDPQPPLHGTTQKSPASHFWGVFFFFFGLCWAFTAAHSFSPAGLSRSYSALAELGLSRRRLLLWGAGPKVPPAPYFSDSSVLPPCTRGLFPRMPGRCFTVWMPQFGYSLTCGWMLALSNSVAEICTTANKAEFHLFCFISDLYLSAFLIYGARRYRVQLVRKEGRSQKRQNMENQGCDVRCESSTDRYVWKRPGRLGQEERPVKTGGLRSRSSVRMARRAVSNFRFLPASARWFQSTPILKTERPGLTPPLLLITVCVRAQSLSGV